MRYLICLLALTGCNAPSDPAVTSISSAQCRGAYSTRDAQGDLHKWNEYAFNGQCFTDNIALTRWESTTEHRRIHNVHCTPQGLTTTLVSANNYYSYRDGRIYLDLNGSTGEYRRITLAEGKDGKQVYTRLQGCFYVRNDATAGQQLLLDTIDTASSQAADFMEIFTYTTTATTLESVRFDDSGDWDFKFCPLDTPWGYCDLLRNGNIMFFSILTAAQQASLLAEAILIRRQFNYATVPSSSFESVWSNPGLGRVEEVREDYKYATAAIVDTPYYIDESWANFLRGERPIMPDVASNRIPLICYDGKRSVILNDGSSSTIFGQICYENNQYTFIQ